MATEVQPAPNGANTRPLKDDSGTAVNGSLTSSDMRCPDPSAHHKDTTLQDHASAAALYSTNSAKRPGGASTRETEVLGSDGKLSSASAATSLKYARAHDLPSFPIVGTDTSSSAGTAALLANANRKSPSYPKVESSSAAGKAALLAHDYKMQPLWQPEASSAGSKAALLAHRDGVKMNLWQPQASANGNSAANIAFKKQGLGPAVNHGQTDDSKRKALIAATGAVSNTGRKRAQSTPAPPLYPDQKNSARNALSAATLAHTPSMKPKKAPVVEDSNRWGSGAMEAARIQHSKAISRDMYTEHPPIRMEVEEKQHQDALRASAISMAKQMMVAQEKVDHSNHAQSGAMKAHGQSQAVTSEEDVKQQAMQYIYVQEAAQKLAAERLAKIGFDENAQYRSYYGYEKPRSKLSIRGRGRQRSSSNPETADSDDDDEFRSRRIRSQMSQLNKTLKDVDAKRDQDRRSLIAAAERKVQAQMQGLDKKIYDETGKMSPAMIDEWDAKARAKAAAASEARMQNHGKVHIGHGKFMDQADIDAVALARIQPTLDEINEKTEKRRAEEEEKRLELEEQKRLQQREKQRTAEIKAEEKRIKDEERQTAKARSAEEKAAKRQEQTAEKEKRAEEQRLQREEKRKSREAPKTGVATAAVPAAEMAATADGPVDAPAVVPDDGNEDLYSDPTPSATRQAPAEVAAAEPASPTSITSPTSPTSPSSGEGKSKGFKGFLSKFKRRSKHSAATAEEEKPGFIGGAALRSHSTPSHRDSAPASPPVATQASAGPSHTSDRYSDVSSLSEDEEDAVEERGRSAERIETKGTGGSGGTEFEEARDEFDEKLAPPPSFTSSDVNAGRKGSPNRDSKFHEVGI